MKYPVIIGLAAMALAGSVQAEEHVVEMKNMGAEGPMVFEPAVVQAAVGDTVRFVPTNPGHNSVSTEGLIPAGATAWEGGLGQEVTVTLDAEGVYVYECEPHTMMAMVGVIVAGEPVNLEEIRANAGDLESEFLANQDRLNNYLSDVE